MHKDRLRVCPSMQGCPLPSGNPILKRKHPSATPVPVCLCSRQHCRPFYSNSPLLSSPSRCAWEHYKEVLLEDSILTDNTRKIGVHLKKYFIFLFLFFPLPTFFVSFFSLFYFFKLCAMCAHLSVGMSICMQVPTNARRGFQLLWDGSYRQCEPPDMGTGNQIPVLCKNSFYS